MTATAYAMSDVKYVRVPDDKGCGKGHEATRDGNGRNVVVCDQCAPHLVGNHASFSGTPEGVPATPDERAYEEYMEKKAKSSNAEVDVEMRRDWLAAKRGQSAPAPSLMDQIRSASPEEKTALRELLGEPKRSPGRPKGSTSAKSS